MAMLDSKKQKLTTLEKTKLDWNNFKRSEGIDEDLESHKKSKDGWVLVTFLAINVDDSNVSRSFESISSSFFSIVSKIS